jgi:hypothetical protein
MRDYIRRDHPDMMTAISYAIQQITGAGSLGVGSFVHRSCI